MPVDDLSVIMLPQFWLEPCANVFEDTVRALEASGTSVPKQMLDFPPGGALMPVDDLSVIMLPQFWFEPWAKLFDEVCRGFSASPP